MSHCVRSRVCSGIALLATAVSLGQCLAQQPVGAKGDPRLERARREVRLLDDIYKTAIVLVTTHYVEDNDETPAGEAFKVLFKSMEEKGWHEVRLLDASGEPVNPDNSPQDDFERKAVAALKSGKAGYEERATVEGKEYLRSATPIPVVMEKCTLCHENYRGKGVIGALAYTLPLE